MCVVDASPGARVRVELWAAWPVAEEAPGGAGLCCLRPFPCVLWIVSGSLAGTRWEQARAVPAGRPRSAGMSLVPRCPLRPSIWARPVLSVGDSLMGWTG